MPDLATITALTAKPGVQQIKVSWELTDPNAGGLPYLECEGVQVVQSLVNDRDDSGAETFEAGLVDQVIAGLAEEVTYYHWARPRFAYVDAAGVRQTYYGEWYPSDPEDGVPASAIGMAGLAYGAANIKIVPSVSSDDLTVTIKTASGDDPSSDNPVYVSFRDTLSADGRYYVLAITAPLSITFAQSGTNKFQTRDGIPFRLWVGIFDVDGTPHIGLTNCLLVDASSESVVIRSLANVSTRNAVTASSSVGSIRSDQVITAKPFRVIGWMAWEDGLATAGTWDAEPTETHLISGDSKWPGDFIADKRQQKEGGASNTGTIPFDGTDPQNTEGTSYASVLMEPTSKANVAETYFIGYVTHSVADTVVTVATFINTEADARDSGYADIRDADKIERVEVTNRSIVNDATLVGWRIGGSQAGTWYLSRNSSINPLPVRATFGWTEIMA